MEAVCISVTEVGGRVYGGASCEKRILLNVQKREFAKSLHVKNLNSLSPFFCVASSMRREGGSRAQSQFLSRWFP